MDQIVKLHLHKDVAEVLISIMEDLIQIFPQEDNRSELACKYHNDKEWAMITETKTYGDFLVSIPVLEAYFEPR